MNERIEKWLHDILIAIEEIKVFLGDDPKLYNDFSANLMLQRAVERNIEIIGEATNRIRKAEVNNLLNAKSDE